MARYYTEISKDEFLEKVKQIMSYGDDVDENDEGYPYNLSKKLLSDLNKVEFDWENFYTFDDKPRSNVEGYKELISGFHVFFCWAGGDWEYPVTFIFYNSDKGIRAYIPSEGNIYNKKTKTAFGNEEDEYVDFSITIDETKIYSDILNRIKLKK